MRKISESFGSNGNSLNNGVMNRYTPIDNIIINVRNIFGSLLGLVVSKGEDGCSLKIQSTTFTDPETTQNIIYNSTFDGRTYLGSYINSMGLDSFKVICIGQNCIAYFYPSNVVDAEKDLVKKVCKEMKESKVYEAEMYGFAPVNNGTEEELEDKTQEEICAIIDNKDKIKAANEFAEKIKNTITLPENVYIKATKDIDGHESIALRWKTEKRRPFGGKSDIVTSLMNIYSTGTNAIWVDAYLNKESLPEDIRAVIENILQFIGAKATDDDCVWNINYEEENDEESEKKNDEEEKKVTVNPDEEDDVNKE